MMQGFFFMACQASGPAGRLLIYTSVTTGKPKAHSCRAVLIKCSLDHSRVPHLQREQTAANRGWTNVVP